MTEELAGAPSLLDLTAEIVTAHVANNSVHAVDLPKMIATVHAALAALGSPESPIIPEAEHKPAVGLRKSLASDDHIISMIDGKPYKTLRRHIGVHGMTEKEYRARYNLPADYPMVAKSYSAARATISRALGLGRKAGQKVAAAAEAVETKVEEVAAPVVEQARRAARKPAKAAEGAKPAAKRGRKPAPEAE